MPHTIACKESTVKIILQGICARRKQIRTCPRRSAVNRTVAVTIFITALPAFAQQQIPSAEEPPPPRLLQFAAPRQRFRLMEDAWLLVRAEKPPLALALTIDAEVLGFLDRKIGDSTAGAVGMGVVGRGASGWGVDLAAYYVMATTEPADRPTMPGAQYEAIVMKAPYFYVNVTSPWGMAGLTLTRRKLSRDIRVVTENGKSDKIASEPLSANWGIDPHIRTEWEPLSLILDAAVHARRTDIVDVVRVFMWDILDRRHQDEQNVHAPFLGAGIAFQSEDDRLVTFGGVQRAFEHFMARGGIRMATKGKVDPGLEYAAVGFIYEDEREEASMRFKMEGYLLGKALPAKSEIKRITIGDLAMGMGAAADFFRCDAVGDCIIATIGISANDPDWLYYSMERPNFRLFVNLRVYLHHANEY